MKKQNSKTKRKTKKPASKGKKATRAPKKMSAARTSKKKKPSRKGTVAKKKKLSSSRKVSKTPFDRFVADLMKSYDKRTSQAAAWFYGFLGSFVFVLLTFQVAGELGKHTSKQKSVYLFREPASVLTSQFSRANQFNLGDRVGFWSTVVRTFDENDQDLLPESHLVSIKDHVPLFPKKYDCTTYVETVAAFAKSKKSADVVGNLLSIRYKEADSSFSSRNHFPTVDWIVNNQSAGNLRDITQKVAKAAGTKLENIEKKIFKRNWLNSKKNLSSGDVREAQNQWPEIKKAKVQYIPVDEVSDLLEKLPQGAIVNVVRENSSRFPVLISHQGFVVKMDGKTYFRHASGKHGKIRTIPLLEYLEKEHDKNKAWKVLGINVNQLI